MTVQGGGDVESIVHVHWRKVQNKKEKTSKFKEET